MEELFSRIFHVSRKMAASHKELHMEQPAFDPITLHSRIAQKFDSRYATVIAFRERLEKWSALIRKWIKPGDSVLDAGCGSGFLTACLSGIAGDITALDGSQEMLNLAKNKFSDEERQKITFVCHRLPLSCDMPIFDAILCSSVLEYLDDMAATLESFYNHLKPGGILILSYPNILSPKRWLDPVAYRLIKKPSFYPYMRNRPKLPGRFAKYLKNFGFEEIQRMYSGRITRINISSLEFILPLFIMTVRKK